MRHRHEVRLGRQLVGRVTPVGAREDAELAALDESLHLLLHVGEVPGRGTCVAADRLRQRAGRRRVRAERRDHVHPVERVQVIEVHDVVVHVLRPDHQISDQVRVRRNLVAQRVLNGAHRGDAMHQRANAADALCERPRVARVAPAQDDLEPAHHGACAVGLRDAALRVGRRLDAQVALDARDRVDDDPRRGGAHVSSSTRLSATSSSRLCISVSHLKWACPSSKVWRQLAQVVTGISAPVFSICSILIRKVL